MKHLLLIFLFLTATAFGHHFKGLPHYNYFENYPQVPEEEFIGQAGDYEVSLVLYDFQGINRDKVESPDNVRLFLVIFNLEDNSVYSGKLTLEILDDDVVLYTESYEEAELENLYSMYRELNGEGDYSLRLTLHDHSDLNCTIPFTLTSQRINWAPWVAVSLGVLLLITAIGARRARVKQDRRESAKARKESEKEAAV